MERTRSEYRLSPVPSLSSLTKLRCREVEDGDRPELGALMLDAYRGTIDDEGETLDEALEAIDHYLEHVLREHSIVVTEGDEIIAMAFVLVVEGVHYVDPVVVAASQKRRGVGRDALVAVLSSLAAADVDEVGATITDGNTASEALFARLGFTRRGSWP